MPGETLRHRENHLKISATPCLCGCNEERTMNKFLERLNAGEVLVADGATGSNLQKMGLKPGRPPEDMIIDSPDTLLKLASSFVDAGSDIVLTCTFGGTRMRMKDS